MVNQTKNFFADKLSLLVLNFKDLHCRYEYQYFSDVHCIEINPPEKIDEIAVKESLAQLFYDFHDTFPVENLMFITANDIFSIDDPSLCIGGEKCSPVFISKQNQKFGDSVLWNRNFQLCGTQ